MALMRASASSPLTCYGNMQRQAAVVQQAAVALQFCSHSAFMSHPGRPDDAFSTPPQLAPHHVSAHTAQHCCAPGDTFHFWIALVPYLYLDCCIDVPSPALPTHQQHLLAAVSDSQQGRR
jgi:hypothetical protein